MAHYFDDVFHRAAGSPKTLKPKMRRSSTARSIGARSDFDTSVNGDDDDNNSLGNSVDLDPEREKEQRDADAHMHQYITDELEKVKSDQDENRTYGDQDEYETHA